MDTFEYVAGRDELLPPDAPDNIPVFLGADDKFFAHAVAVIASVMESASRENHYDLFIVHDGVPPEKLALTSKWMRQYPNATLRFVDIKPMMDGLGRDAFKVTRHLSIAMFFRIFAPTIFAQYDKIAYLDSDIAVFADVAGFYNQELGENLLGACHDFTTERQSLVNPDAAAFWKRELGKEPGEDYFFSGGVVMNLRQMRAENTEAAMLRKMPEIKNSNLPDQDLMNAVLNHRVKYIECEWNYLDWMTDEEEESQNFGRLGEEALTLVRNARSRYHVLHFSEKKPWTAAYLGKNEEVYWRYAAKTPFYAETRQKFEAECALAKTLPQYLTVLWQITNFRTRLLLASPAKKAKYRSRLHNLLLRKRRLRGLMRT